MKKLIFLSILLFGCTNNKPQKKENNYTVICFSGGERIFYGFSKEVFRPFGRGVSFVDNETGFNFQILADCMVTRISEHVQFEESNP